MRAHVHPSLPAILIGVDSWDRSPHDTAPWHMRCQSGQPVGRGREVHYSGVIAVGIGLFLYLISVFFPRVAQGQPRSPLAFTEDNYTAAVGLFILLYIAVTGLSLPGATILTLAGGFVFGAVPATLYVNIGATTGATLAFLAARYVLRDWVEQKFGKWLEPLQQGFAKNAFSYLLTLRLIPLFPFFVVNDWAME